MKFAWSLLVACAVPTTFSLAACSSSMTTNEEGMIPTGTSADASATTTEPADDDAGVTTVPSSDASVVMDGSVIRGDDDAGDSGPVSPGLPETDTTYPSAAPDMASLVMNTGGTILSTPKIVTIVYSNDANLTAIEDFSTKIGSSAYWTGSMQEWGIGAATNTNYVISGNAPTTLNDADFDTLVSSGIESGGWPANDAQTMYVLWIPTTTKISTMDDSGKTVDACTQYAGYHTETNYSDTSTKAKHYVYAIVAEGCSDPTQPTVFASATETAAHEIAEAATDPLPDITPGLLYFDTKHFAWEIFQEEQDEIADACEFYASSYYEERADLPYYVSRLWSNASAAAGKNPCVPLQDGPYYNVSNVAPETVTVKDDDGVQHTTEGYRIGVGQTKTIHFQLYSDEAVTGGWFVSAAEGDGVNTPAGNLSLVLNTTQGVNGDMGSVAVTVNKTSGKSTAQLITITSSHGGYPSHYMPILVGSY